MKNEIETGFQDKWLWDDPLKYEKWFDKNRGAVLVGEEIELYVKKYGLLIEKNYEKGTLRGACFSMTPDPDGAWIFDDAKRKSSLKIDKDEIGSYLLVPNNSLVYIRLQQTIKLPFYIIARHNLKIRYIYQGLLLGTGPQVDPGYWGRYYVPLHNLTDSDVKIYLEKTFVAIDFIRTSSLHILNVNAESRDEFYRKNPNIPVYPQYKIDREQLEDYLEGNTPASSLGSLVEDLRLAESKFKMFLQKIKYDVIGGAAVIIAVFAVMTGAYFHLENKFQSIYEDKVSMIANSISIKNIEQSIRDNNSELKNLSNRLAHQESSLKQNEPLKIEMYKIVERINSLESIMSVDKNKGSNKKND